ncbi:MAG: TIR domain-containing protein [Steroidobacterales bacterium]
MLTEPSRAVFLSYASQDAEAARHICEALRSSGVEVWFDQSELRGGDAWDQKIRQQIRDCALFIPIISAHTTSRPEGYFRLEWGIADQRTQMIARNKAFIIPVCVDGTPESIPDLPESFLRVQWTRLAAGATPPSFCQRIATLLGGSGQLAAPQAATHPTPSQPTLHALPPGPVLAPGPRQAPTFNRWIVAAAALLLAVGAVALKPWRFLAARPAADATTEFGATTRAAAPGAAALLVSEGAAAAPERSIAVLPFTDMSEKKDQEYFSDGLSEELIDLLTKVPDLRVPARTSSFYFKGQHATIAEMAKALSVSHVLEGSVRKAGNTIRVTAQLIRADNGYHLWSQTYDRDLKDVFKVQDEIAGRVVEELKLTLPAAASANAERTGNAAAHSQYLLGRKFFDQPTPEGFKSAVDAFKSAIALDPGYTAAYARLALAEAHLADMTGDPSGLTRATAAAERAITLAPQAADGYYARADLRSTFLWDWDGARADYSKALAIDPNNSDTIYGYSDLLGTQGQLPEAMAQVDKAIRIDPLVATFYSLRARLLLDSGDLAAARDAYQQLLRLNPAHPHANVDLAIIELLSGRPEQASAYLQRPAAPGWLLMGRTLVEYSLGHAQQSQQALDQTIHDTAQFAAYQIASLYAWRGQKDQAFQWLERAYTQHDGGLTEVKNDPLLASLRTDARYQAFLVKMKLSK